MHPFNLKGKNQLGAQLSILLLMVLLFSCQTKEDKTSDRLFTFRSKPGMYIKIENSGSQETSFSLNLNNNNFNKEQAILQQIDEMPDEYLNEPNERKAWRFVSNNINRSSPITGERWQHSPLLMLNSIGFGQCDDFASVLSFIWKKQGFHSRVWGLEGHVVPEVFANNKWQMYDPLQGVYYLNSENKVASVEELSSAPEYITNPRIEENIHLNDSLNFFSIIHYSKRLAQKYSSVNDNKVNEWYDVSTENIEFQICLPSAAYLEFPIDYPSGIFTTGFLGEEKELRCFMKISIPGTWKGKLILPFVIASVQGKGEVELNNKYYSLEEDSLNQLLKKFMTFNNTLSIKSISGKVDIYCLLNPDIFRLSGNDSLSLRGKNLASISATGIQGNTADTASTGIDKEKVIGKLIQGHYKYYKRNQNKLDNLLFNPSKPTSNKNKLIRNIKVYLNGMDDMELEGKTARTNILIDKIEKFYALFPGNAGEQQLAKLMSDPVTFIMFVSVLEVSNEQEMANLLKKRVSGIF